MDQIQLLETLLTKYDDAYYNTKKPIVSDAEYDSIREQLEALHPDSPALQKVGHIVSDKQPSILPVWMGSLDKRKADSKTLPAFLTKSPSIGVASYTISEKLDGVSLLLYWNSNTETYRCYTRGNGTAGVDVTATLLDSLQLPSLSDTYDTYEEPITFIRGEVIIPKSAVGDICASKDTNLRSIVNGVITAKVPKPSVLKHIQFIAYSIPESEEVPPVQFDQLAELGFRTPRNVEVQEDTVTVSNLTDMLEEWTAESDYEIDGLVVARDLVEFSRSGKNPAHTVAFKALFDADTRITTVQKVEWNVSKDGYLKPRILFDPVQMGGHTVQWATGYNARYIKNEGINVGAVIQVVRSGQVIPKVVKVIQAAAVAAHPTQPCEWTPGNVDLVTQTKSSATQLAYFLKTIGAKNMSSAFCKKVDVPLETFLSWGEDDFRTIDGVTTSAKKLYSSLHTALSNSAPEVLMVACNLIGRGIGVRRLRVLMHSHGPDILRVSVGQTRAERIAIIANVPTFSTILAEQYVNGLDLFYTYLKVSPTLRGYFEHAMSCTPASDTSHDASPSKVAGLKFVCTGKRDNQLELLLVEAGAKLQTNVSSTTDFLIHSGNSSSKLTKAKSIPSIQLYTVEECRNWITG